MMNRLSCIAVILAGTLFGQGKPTARGHWEGVIKIPKNEMKVIIDLDVNESGAWKGSLDLPAQNIRGLPLKDISIQANMLAFALDGLPGNPTFDGEISPDGLILKGDFASEGGGVAGELKWVSDPKVAAPVRSTAITRELEGEWEGAITLPDGKTLHSRFIFSTAADGTGSGKFVSLNQDNAELPMSWVAQDGARVKFEIRAVGGSYAGELKGGELAGTWTQGPGSMPLALKRPAK